MNKGIGASTQQQQQKTGSAPSAARGDVTESIISDLEFGMVQSLDFELGIHGAHRALYGLILDIQTVMPQLTQEDLLLLAGKAQTYLHLSRLTDAEFLYTPSHIALASCWMCHISTSSSDPEPLLGKDIVKKWLESKEERSAQLFKQKRSERTAWQQKMQTLQHETFSPDSTLSQDSSSHEYPKSSHVYDFGLSVSRVESILNSISQLIESVISSPISASAPKPAIDLDRVKQIDLNLRGCLSVFDAMQQKHSRKRPADQDTNASKRARFPNEDSDSEDS